MTAKYHNKKTVIDGITFDSQAEARYYLQLKALKQAGEVAVIECHPLFTLLPTYWKCCGIVRGSLELKKGGKCPDCGKKVPATRAITYSADFRVTYADGRVEVVDVKGMETRAFQMRKKLLEYRYPEITLKVVKGVRR
jgi:predicted Zn-ribbon and HTH transcriptional regulator